MLDTLRAADVAPGPSPRSTVAALLLHLLLIAAAIELNLPPPLPSPAWPRVAGPPGWLVPPPDISPFRGLPYMPTVDGAGMMRRPLRSAALVGLNPHSLPLLEADEQRAGITGAVKPQYVIDHSSLGRLRLGQVTDTTDREFGMSCIGSLLGAGFNTARRAAELVGAVSASNNSI